MADWDSFSSPVPQEDKAASWDSFSSPVKTEKHGVIDGIKDATSKLGSAVDSAVSNPKETLSNIGKNTDKIGGETELGSIPNLDTAKAVVKAPFYGAMNAYDTVAGLNEDFNPFNPMNSKENPYANSSTHKIIDELNQMHEQELKNTPYGQTTNFVAQAVSTPVPELNLVKGAKAGASSLSKVGTAIAKGGQTTVEGGMLGAEFGAEQPKPATDNSTDLANQAEQTLTSGATAGALTNLGANAVPTWLKEGWQGLTKGWFTDKSAKKIVGENLPNVLGAQGEQQVRDHVNNPDAKDMTVADITQNPDAASAEKVLFKGKDKTDLLKRKQDTNTQISDELEHLNLTNADKDAIKPAAQTEVESKQSFIDNASTPIPEYKNQAIESAPTPVEAQTQVGAVARDVSNTERQAIKDSYDAIAPDETVVAPHDQIKEDFNSIREKTDDETSLKNSDVISEQDDKGKLTNSFLARIHDRYTGDSPVSVHQQIQDKNNIGDYVSSLYKSLRTGGLDSDQEFLIKQKIKIAQDMRDSIKSNVSNMNDIPSAVKDKSVGEAFGEAENRYKEYQSKYIENPEQYKVNSEGTKYNHSTSAFGDYDYRLQKGTAGTLAEEGKKLLPVENPDALGATLKNIRNIQDADGLVKSNLLAVIRQKGYDKGFTPEVQTQLEQNGFEGVSKDIQKIGQDLKGRNATIDQTNQYLERMRGEEQGKLEKTFASNFLKDNNGDVVKFLQDKQWQKEALDLADKQNDGGATRRGLGQSVLDHIKSQTIETVPNKLGEGEVRKADYEKFYGAFSANKDLLRKVLSPDEFKAIDTLGRELQQNTFMGRTNAGAENTIADDKLSAKINAIAIKGAISKIAGVPIGSAASFAGTMNSISQGRLEAVVKDALANPKRAVELMDAARAAQKEPGLFKQTIDFMFDRLPEAGVINAPPTDVRENKNVNPAHSSSNTDFNSNNSSTEVSANEESLLQKFANTANPISDAEAAGVNSKRGSPVQLIGANEQPLSKKNDDQLASIKSRQSIQNAAKTGNVTGEYLQGLEHMESGKSKDPSHARPLDKNGDPMSSAVGVGQWLVGSWEDIRKHHPDLPPITAKNDPRTNDDIARKANAYEAADNYKRLIKDKVLPWEPTAADVYGTHVMGYEGFKKFYAAGNKNKNGNPADVVPQAVKNNPAIFTHKGRPATYNEAYRNLMKTFQYGQQEASN